MIRILQYLSDNRLFNILICIGFYLLVTLPHELVGVSVASVFKGVSRKNYDLTILCIGVALLFGFGFLLFKQLRKLEKPIIPLAFFILCIGLMMESLYMLIIVNIEIIHFIQYAVLAILLFPLCKHFLSTLALVTFLGAIDEAYQYYYLSPQRTNYYDFNDVILNLIGAAIGLTFLRSHKGISNFLMESGRKLNAKVWIYFTAFISFFTVLIWQHSKVQFLLDSIGLSIDWTNFWSVLIRIPTTGFWTEIPPKVIYHVVQPLEGIIVICILFLIFGNLNYKAE